MLKISLRQVVAQVHRPGVHLCPYLRAGAVEEAGVGEEHPALGGPQSVGELKGHAQLFIHNADEHAPGSKAETGLDGLEQAHLLRHLIGGLQLGGHLVDHTLAAVGTAGGQWGRNRRHGPRRWSPCHGWLR